MTSPAAVVVLAPAELEAIVQRAVHEALAAYGAAQRGTEAPATVREAAQALRCSERQVRKLIACGRLRASKLDPGGSSRVLIPRDAIQELLAQGER